MAEVFQTEWILSSWPWRLGSVLYDPIQGMDIQAWDLQDMVDHPGLYDVAPKDLDPRRPVSERIVPLHQKALLDQELLRAMYEIRDEDPRLVGAKISDLGERELENWLEPYGIAYQDLGLDAVDGLYAKLEDMSPEEHHHFLSDWWETWEMPYPPGQSSIFRSEAGPGGQLYAATYGDDALEVWQTEQKTLGLHDFSLWAVMRSHWGWRLEFPDQPRPEFPVIEQLDQIFG